MESTSGLSSSPSNCARILSRVISVLSKKEEVEERNSSTFYLSGSPKASSNSQQRELVSIEIIMNLRSLNV